MHAKMGSLVAFVSIEVYSVRKKDYSNSSTVVFVSIEVYTEMGCTVY